MLQTTLLQKTNVVHYYKQNARWFIRKEKQVSKAYKEHKPKESFHYATINCYLFFFF